MSARVPIDPPERLARVLVAHAARAGLAVEARVTATRTWASATFVGERCRIMVRGANAAWLESLSEADLPLPGHYVADLAVLTTDDATELEALLIAAA